VLQLIENNYKTYKALQVNNGKGVSAMDMGSGGVGNVSSKMLGAATMGARKKGKFSQKGKKQYGLGADEEMDIDDGDEDGNGITSVDAVTPEFIRGLVEKVLNTDGFVDMRASKMSQDDFLRLLATFNEAGIHFA
jgi:18S rRNA (adenine1779-N6/adenine1780-N6)-dimethyltransferase